MPDKERIIPETVQRELDGVPTTPALYRKMAQNAGRQGMPEEQRLLELMAEEDERASTIHQNGGQPSGVSDETLVLFKGREHVLEAVRKMAGFIIALRTQDKVDPKTLIVSLKYGDNPYLVKYQADADKLDTSRVQGQVSAIANIFGVAETQQILETPLSYRSIDQFMRTNLGSTLVVRQTTQRNSVELFAEDPNETRKREVKIKPDSKFL